MRQAMTRDAVKIQLDKKKRPYIKVCGLKSSEAVRALNHQIDFAGFIFAPSRRQIQPDEAAKLIQELDDTVLRVGVFVNASDEEILRTKEVCQLDILQLHGDEPEDQIRRLIEAGSFVVKAFRAGEEGFDDEIEMNPADLILLDAPNPGSGKQFNWNKITTLRPFLLAGGLGADNLIEASRTDAAGFDLSSSLETNGEKDLTKIKELENIAEQLKSRP